MPRTSARDLTFPFEHPDVVYYIDTYSASYCDEAEELPAAFEPVELSGDGTGCAEFSREDAPFTPVAPEADDRYFSNDPLCLGVVYHPLLPHETGCED